MKVHISRLICWFDGILSSGVFFLHVASEKIIWPSQFISHNLSLCAGSIFYHFGILENISIQNSPYGKELHASVNEGFLFYLAELSTLHLSRLPDAKILPAFTAKVEATAKCKVSTDSYLCGAIGRRDVNPSEGLCLYGAHDL